MLTARLSTHLFLTFQFSISLSSSTATHRKTGILRKGIIITRNGRGNKMVVCDQPAPLFTQTCQELYSVETTLSEFEISWDTGLLFIYFFLWGSVWSIKLNCCLQCQRRVMGANSNPVLSQHMLMGKQQGSAQPLLPLLPCGESGSSSWVLVLFFWPSSD